MEPRVTHHVVLLKKGSSPLGLKLLETRKRKGVYINGFVPALRPTELHKLHIGDLLKQIDGTDVSKEPLPTVLAAIDAARKSPRLRDRLKDNQDVEMVFERRVVNYSFRDVVLDPRKEIFFHNFLLESAEDGEACLDQAKLMFWLEVGRFRELCTCCPPQPEDIMQLIDKFFDPSSGFYLGEVLDVDAVRERAERLCERLTQSEAAAAPAGQKTLSRSRSWYEYVVAGSDLAFQLFSEPQAAVEADLAAGAFMAFRVSDWHARMTAHLAGSAAFLAVPFHAVLQRRELLDVMTAFLAQSHRQGWLQTWLGVQEVVRPCLWRLEREDKAASGGGGAGAGSFAVESDQIRLLACACYLWDFYLARDGHQPLGLHGASEPYNMLKDVLGGGVDLTKVETGVAVGVGTACCRLQEDMTRRLITAIYPEFQSSSLYEQLCLELGGAADDTMAAGAAAGVGAAAALAAPSLPRSSRWDVIVPRMTRQASFPGGISVHRPPLDEPRARALPNDSEANVSAADEAGSSSENGSVVNDDGDSAVGEAEHWAGDDGDDADAAGDLRFRGHASETLPATSTSNSAARSNSERRKSHGSPDSARRNSSSSGGDGRRASASPKVNGLRPNSSGGLSRTVALLKQYLLMPPEKRRLGRPIAVPASSEGALSAAATPNSRSPVAHGAVADWLLLFEGYVDASGAIRMKVTLKVALSKAARDGSASAALPDRIDSFLCPDLPQGGKGKCACYAEREPSPRLFSFALPGRDEAATCHGACLLMYQKVEQQPLQQQRDGTVTGATSSPGNDEQQALHSHEPGDTPPGFSSLSKGSAWRRAASDGALFRKASSPPPPPTTISTAASAPHDGSQGNNASALDEISEEAKRHHSDGLNSSAPHLHQKSAPAAVNIASNSVDKKVKATQRCLRQLPYGICAVSIQARAWGLRGCVSRYFMAYQDAILTENNAPSGVREAPRTPGRGGGGAATSDRTANMPSSPFTSQLRHHWSDMTEGALLREVEPFLTPPPQSFSVASPPANKTNQSGGGAGGGFPFWNNNNNNGNKASPGGGKEKVLAVTPVPAVADFGAVWSELEFDPNMVFRSLNPRHLCIMVASLLCEHKVLIMSDRWTLLVLACETLRWLLRPLTWPHVYVPLLPRCMVKDFLQCPTPFFVGVPKSFCRGVTLPDAVKIDLDTQHCWTSDGVETGHEPFAIVLTRLLTMVNPTFPLFDEPFWDGTSGGSGGSGGARNGNRSEPSASVKRDHNSSPLPPPPPPSERTNAQPSASEIISVFRESIGDLLRGTGECCFSVGRGAEQVTFFDEKLFARLKRSAALEEVGTYAHVPRFLQIFCKTQMHSQWVAAEGPAWGRQDAADDGLRGGSSSSSVAAQKL